MCSVLVCGVTVRHSIPFLLTFAAYFEMRATDATLQHDESTCNGQGDRCICVKEATEYTVIEASNTTIETYDEEAEEDRIGTSRDRLIRCDACSEYACICGDYD